MMKCPNCGAEMPDNSIFCGKCGQRISRQTAVHETSFSKAPAEDLTFMNCEVVTGDRSFYHGYVANVTLGADTVSYKVIYKESPVAWGCAFFFLGFFIAFGISKAIHKNDSPVVIYSSDILQVSFADRGGKPTDVRILKKDGSVLRIRFSPNCWEQAKARLQSYTQMN